MKTSLSTAGCPVMRFILQKQLRLPRGMKQSAETHLAMDGQMGGRFAVPPELEYEFLQSYAESIEQGSRLYLSENRTDIFPFFIDADFGFEAGAGAEAKERKLFLQIIISTVQLFFPALREEEKDFLPTVGETGRGNMHIVFPELLVRSEAAVAMAGGIISKLGAATGWSKIGPDFCKIIDTAVYTTSGLRMVGSRKCRKCTACAGRAAVRLNCSVCVTTGKEDLGNDRIYRLTESPRAETDIGNIYREVLALSIRRPAATAVTSGWQLYVGCPTRIMEDKKLRRSKHSTVLEPTDPVLRTARKIIRSTATVYGELNIRTAVFNQKKQEYTVRVYGDNQQFCYNKGGPHGSNSIYFLIGRRGVFACCFSTKTPTGTMTPCSEFRKKFSVFGAEIDRLFGYTVPALQPPPMQEHTAEQIRLGCLLNERIRVLHEFVYPPKTAPPAKKKRKCV